MPLKYCLSHTLVLHTTYKNIIPAIIHQESSPFSAIFCSFLSRKERESLVVTLVGSSNTNGCYHLYVIILQKIWLDMMAERCVASFCPVHTVYIFLGLKTIYPVGNKSASYYPKLGPLLYKMA